MKNVFETLKSTSLFYQTAFIIGFLSAAAPCTAQAATRNDFSSIARNITTSVEELPGLLTGVSYMMGLLLGVLGILKLKDHVENPTQTHLKDGAIRLASGGALFALPIVFEAMRNTIGMTTAGVEAPTLHKVEMNVR